MRSEPKNPETRDPVVWNFNEQRQNRLGTENLMFISRQGDLYGRLILKANDPVNHALVDEVIKGKVRTERSEVKIGFSTYMNESFLERISSATYLSTGKVKS